MTSPRFQDGDTVRLISDEQSRGIVVGSCRGFHWTKGFDLVGIEWQAGRFAGAVRIHRADLLMHIDLAPIGGAA